MIRGKTIQAPPLHFCFHANTDRIAFKIINISDKTTPMIRHTLQSLSLPFFLDAKIVCRKFYFPSLPAIQITTQNAMEVHTTARSRYTAITITISPEAIL